MSDQINSNNFKPVEFDGIGITFNLLFNYGEFAIIRNHPDFNYTEFGIIKNAAGSSNFVLSAKQWIEKTNAIGIIAKTGRYGGTYAHKDIAITQMTSLVSNKQIKKLK